MTKDMCVAEEEKIPNVSYGIVYGLLASAEDGVSCVITDNGAEMIDLHEVPHDIVLLPTDYVKLFTETVAGSEEKRITKIEPWERKRRTGIVTKISPEKYGLIDKDIIFYPDSQNLFANSKYEPKLNDQVDCEIITCEIDINGNSYKWRCISMELLSRDEPDELDDPDEPDDGVQVSDNSELKRSVDCFCHSVRVTVCVKNSTNVDMQVSHLELSETSLLRCLNRDLNESYKVKINNDILYVFEVNKMDCKTQWDEAVKLHFDNGKIVERIISIDFLNRCSHMRANVVNNLFYVPIDFAEVTRDTIDELIPPINQMNIKTYGPILHGLLYLEELNLLKSFEEYARKAQYFKPTGKDQFFELAMNNLHELRPSIITGDKIIATTANEPHASFAGFVKKVCLNYLVVKFGDDFQANFNNNESFDICFRFTRTVYVRKHRAIEHAVNTLGTQILFPSKIEQQRQVQLNVSLVDGNLLLNSKEKITWFQENLNEYQQKAVMYALRGECRPLPYIIHGPPGTGKTTTLAEIILQIYTHIPDSKILIAAQSNSSANYITQLLVKVGNFTPNQLARIMGKVVIDTRPIPEEIQKYCIMLKFRQNNESEEDDDDDDTNSSEHSSIKRCDVDDVQKYQIMLGTCVSFGMFYGKFSNHFTHVFIDEGGQCDEGEALIPITCFSDSVTQIILAGDPMQMPPLVMSMEAKNRGLDISFMERYLNMYTNFNKTDSHSKTTKFDPRLIVKLFHNYRSLPSILQFYNEHFYDMELIPTISATDSDEAKLLKQLQDLDIFPKHVNDNSDFGVYFFNVDGKNERVKESMSWFNQAEAQQIIEYVSKLLKADLRCEDIGIISPYRLQASLIERELKRHSIFCKVGSVEEFQGEERKVILMSTVRTSKLRSIVDPNRNLGFIRCPKRINVSISRARSAFLVFGKEKLLSKDTKWSALIDYCKRNNHFFTN